MARWQDEHLDLIRQILSDYQARHPRTAFDYLSILNMDDDDFLRVYGKGRLGLPCPRCGTSLEHLTVGGRGTTVCPRCQRLPSSGTDSR